MSQYSLDYRIVPRRLVHQTSWETDVPARYLMFSLLAAVCLMIAVAGGLQDGQWTFWICNFVFFGVMLNYLILLRQRRDMFEPVILVAGMMTIAFALRGLYLHSDMDMTLVNPWILSNRDLLGRMSLYAVGGFALFLLGYYCPVGRLLASRLPRFRTNWDMATLGRRAVGIYLLCLPARLLRLLGGAAGPLQGALMQYLGNVIGLIASLTDLAVLLYGIYYYNNRRSGSTEGRGMFFALLAVQTLTGLFSGFREPLLILLLAVLFVRHYVWRPGRPAYVLVLLLGAMLLATPISRAYRHLVFEHRQPVLSAIAAMPGQVVDDIYKHGTSDESGLVAYSRQNLVDLSHRFHGADSLIACMATVPEYLPYQNGKTLYLLPVSVFIPRALWPEKPKIGLGAFFRENIWKAPTNQSNSGGQIAISQLGELYINFGAWGIAAGMLVLGVLHRLGYAYTIEATGRRNFTALLFYFPMVLCFLAMERNFAFAYGYLLKSLLFVYFLCRYLNRGPVFSKT